MTAVSNSIYFSKVKYIGGMAGSMRKFTMLLDLDRQKIEYLVIEKNEAIVDYQKKLSTGAINQILPFCKLCDFERYLLKCEKNLSNWEDQENSIGYRDGISITFYGQSEPNASEIKMDMSVLYDKQYQPPHEKLYGFLIRNFLLQNKDLKQYIFR